METSRAKPALPFPSLWLKFSSIPIGLEGRL